MILKSSIVILVFVSSSLFSLNLETIQIESSKIDVSYLDTPHTVRILDEKNIEMSNVESMRDLTSVIPNTVVSGLGNRYNNTFSVRGMNNYLSYESSVAIYVDDAPVPFSYGYGSIDFKNIAKVEMFLGAQGTQFGKGAHSAVINLYSKAITDKTSSDVKLELGEYGKKSFYGRVSGASIYENLDYAFSITKDVSDGFSKNLQTGNQHDHKDLLGFSTKLVYTPNSSTSVSLNYTKSKTDDGGSAFKQDTKEDPFKIDNEAVDDYSKVDNDILSLVIKYRDGDSKITSVTSYGSQDVLNHNYVYIVGGLVIENDIEIEEFTQELRYTSSPFDSATFLMGLFYSNKLRFDYKEIQTLRANGAQSKNIIDYPDTNMAVFTQIKYFLYDKYELMAGLRYQRIKRDFSRTLNRFTQSSEDVSASTTWNHFLPTLSLSYYIDESSHLYTTFTKGYRPGGYSYRVVGDALTPFSPETTNSYELGYKKMAKAWGLSSALFYNDIKNMRSIELNNNLVSSSNSIAKAYSYGVELGVNYESQKLKWLMNLGLIKAKMGKYKTPTGQHEGNNIIEIPDITFSTALEYLIHKDVYTRTNFKYVGERYYNKENTAKESGYGVVDFIVGYKQKGWEVSFYVNNILDKEYVDLQVYTQNTDASQTHNYYHFAPPRVAGINLYKEF